MFLAHTKDKKIFKTEKVKKSHKSNKLKGLSLNKDFYQIKLDLLSNIGLFLVKQFCCFCAVNPKKKYGKLMKMDTEGSDKIESYMSIEKIIKNIRHTKQYIKNQNTIQKLKL